MITVVGGWTAAPPEAPPEGIELDSANSYEEREHVARASRCHRHSKVPAVGDPVKSPRMRFTINQVNPLAAAAANCHMS